MGCTVSNVSYDRDDAVNLVGLRTYDWSNISRPLRADPVFVERFQQAADAGLRSKGFARSKGSPDFVISLHRSVDLQRNAFDGNYPYATYRGYLHNRGPHLDQYTQEILYINFYRAGTKDLIWHGARSARYVPGLTPGDNEVKANKAATEILENFPAMVVTQK